MGMDYIQAHTFHGRKGQIENSFSYAVDYLLLDFRSKKRFPKLFSHNHFNFFSIYDKDHGGPPKNGIGLSWVQNILKVNDLPGQESIFLLAQPRLFGFVFNPVSFWLCFDSHDNLRVVIAEVSTLLASGTAICATVMTLGQSRGLIQLRQKKFFMFPHFNLLRALIALTLISVLTGFRYQ